MHQSKLKKVMRLTQQWIQDSKYKNHAETMHHRQWMQPVDIGKRANDLNWTTYMFTYADTCSTKSSIGLADYCG